MSDALACSKEDARIRRASPENVGSTVIRLLLADDHTLVRQSLADRLSLESDLSVVAAVPTAAAAVENIESARPDVVLMDIDMPGLDCFAAAAQITRRVPAARVIFLSAFFHDRYIEEALRVQARGYVTKREPPEVLIRAIREVARGGVFFSDDVRSRLVLGDDSVHLGPPPQTRGESLTPRELQILRLVAQGMAKKEMAAQIDLSVKTIENHVASIMRKLDLHDRVALTRYAIREGLVEA